MNGNAVLYDSRTESSAAWSCTYLDLNEPANSISKLEGTLSILGVLLLDPGKCVLHGSEKFDITSWFECFK